MGKHKIVPNNSRVMEKARESAVSFIRQQDSRKQIRIMRQALKHGLLTPEKLRKELEANAPLEMRKGSARIIKYGGIPTVDLLLTEYRREPEFQALAAEVGLDAEYFQDIAEQEIARLEKA